MDIFDVITSRRSIKNFTDRSISNEAIQQLLQIAVQAPNHRLTEPWRFYVLGPEGRGHYGAALGARKAKKIEDPAAADAVLQKVAETHRDLPAMLAVSMTVDENPEIREEDYASTFMAIQNLCLAACAMGLGTHVKSGAVMDDPSARAAVGVGENERIVATISLGEPADIPAPKHRHEASDFTKWVP
ncbi:MAG: nitroreductase [Gemmatimonadetes bacterium]|nr:nitroreductase [Gemmatimonadota bacterium]MDA1102651.1 nitroreductase [Gemmatimonadota bacterium]